MTEEQSLRGRVTRQGEEALGKFAQELLDNPVVTGALSRAFEARERATRAQELAMGVLNIPSAADIERAFPYTARVGQGRSYRPKIQAMLAYEVGSRPSRK